MGGSTYTSILFFKSVRVCTFLIFVFSRPPSVPPLPSCQRCLVEVFLWKSGWIQFTPPQDMTSSSYSLPRLHLPLLPVSLYLIELLLFTPLLCFFLLAVLLITPLFHPLCLLSPFFLSAFSASSSFFNQLSSFSSLLSPSSFSLLITLFVFCHQLLHLLEDKQREGTITVLDSESFDFCTWNIFAYSNMYCALLFVQMYNMSRYPDWITHLVEQATAPVPQTLKGPLTLSVWQLFRGNLIIYEFLWLFSCPTTKQ